MESLSSVFESEWESWGVLGSPAETVTVEELLAELGDWRVKCSE